MQGFSIAWSAPSFDFDGSRDTADPLGFRSYANQLARELVPGLTQVTWRTRGYSLLCKGLALAQRSAEAGEQNPVEAFLRFERLWVGAQRAVHGDRARWAGVRMASLLLSEDQYRLDRPLTSHQLYSGLWGAYRRSAVALRLIEPSGNRSGPAGYKLSMLGKELASAVTEAAFIAKVHLSKHIAKDSLPSESLRSFIVHEPPGELPSEREVQILSMAMRAADPEWDGALQSLRQAHDHGGNGSLELDTLVDQKLLTDTQQRAVKAARELLVLMDAIEKPYRLWVTGSSPEPIPSEIWKHAGWETIHRWPVPELSTLPDTLRSVPQGAAVFDQLHKHHAWLMAQRGAEPWEEGIETATRGTYQAPEFCLPSASRLFAEGVLQGEHS